MIVEVSPNLRQQGKTPNNSLFPPPMKYPVRNTKIPFRSSSPMELSPRLHHPPMNYLELVDFDDEVTLSACTTQIRGVFNIPEWPPYEFCSDEPCYEESCYDEPRPVEHRFHFS